MGLLDLLQTVGDKLGILEMSRGQSASPPKIQTRTVTLAELATEIRSEEVRALAEQPAELSVRFEEVFETAGIKPGADAWTVDRLRQTLLSAAYKDLPRETAQKKILEVLSAEKVSTEDIIRDAMARDKALDSFEAFARTKQDERSATLERKVAEVEDGIKRLQAELAELQQKKMAGRERWVAWRRQKKAREQEMAWAVGYLIDRPVVSITDEE